MKKKILLAMLATLMVGSAMFGVAYASGKITILVNGKAILGDVAPRKVNDRVMVPISFISKALGADVSWDEKTQTVNVKSYGITPRDFFKGDAKLEHSFTMAEINNTIQLFITGMDIGDTELIMKSSTGMTEEYVRGLADWSFYRYGQTILSAKIADIRAIKETKPREYQVMVAVQTSDMIEGNAVEEFWDFHLVQNIPPYPEGKSTLYLVKIYGIPESNVVKEHRMFPGYTYKTGF